ncbi:MAG TPA: ABC transporter permease, partial [Thermoanaerobaculia bacterium]
LLLAGAGVWGGQELIERTRKDAKVAVLNPRILLPFTLPEGSRARLEPAGGRSEAELRALIGEKKLDGLLILRSLEDAELVVSKEPRWRGDLEAALTAARQQARLRALGLSPEALAEAMAPFAVRVVIHEKGVRPKTLGDKIVAIVLITIMLMGTWTGLAYFLIGISGEKQLRVTEQVVSAISPQTWVDGKLLGVTALIFATLLNYAVTTVLTMVAGRALGLALPALPAAAANPALVAAFVLLTLLGLFFWNGFFAAVTATINDPNTSARGALLFVPLLPVLFAFIALKDPDNGFLRILGLLPGTSSAVLPARMALTDVAWWEFPVALLLLIAGTLLLRRAAGKIFAVGMLMYGKEPRWSEVWRWVRAA